MRLTGYFAVIANFMLSSVFVFTWAVPPPQSSTCIVFGPLKRCGTYVGIRKEDVTVHHKEGGVVTKASDRYSFEYSAYMLQRFIQVLGEQINVLYDSGFIPREKDCVFVADDRNDNYTLGGPNIYAAYLNEKKGFTFVPVPYTIIYTCDLTGFDEYEVYSKHGSPNQMLYLNSYGVVTQVRHASDVTGTSVAVYKQHITVPYDALDNSYVVPTKQFAAVLKKAYKVLIGKRPMEWKKSAEHVVKSSRGTLYKLENWGGMKMQLQPLVNNIITLDRQGRKNLPLGDFADSRHFLIKGRLSAS